jgi:hypothetical protein
MKIIKIVEHWIRQNLGIDLLSDFTESEVFKLEKLCLERLWMDVTLKEHSINSFSEMNSYLKKCFDDKSPCPLETNTRLALVILAHIYKYKDIRSNKELKSGNLLNQVPENNFIFENFQQLMTKRQFKKKLKKSAVVRGFSEDRKTVSLMLRFNVKNRLY